MFLDKLLDIERFLLGRMGIFLLIEMFDNAYIQYIKQTDSVFLKIFTK